MDRDLSKKLDDLDKKLSKVLKAVGGLEDSIQQLDCSAQLYELEGKVKEIQEAIERIEERSRGRIGAALSGSRLRLLRKLTRVIMAGSLDPNDLVTLDALTIANMWESSALVEVLELRHVESGTVAVLSHI